MPLVSVIIPTFNRAKHVLEALDSVFAQTFTDYEVLVIDDGSIDSTPDALKPLADSGKIRYFQQANGGQSAARNAGIAQARGAFLAFLDDDDLWAPEKLSDQTQILLTDPDCALVGGAVHLVDKDGHLYHKVPGETRTLTGADILAHCPFWSPGQTLIRRSALEAAGGFDLEFQGAEDYELYLRLSATGTVFFDARLALFYRLHGGNFSTNRHVSFLSVHSAIQEHRGKFSPEAAQNAFLWLYDYRGRESLRAFKKALKCMQLKAACKELSILGRLVRPAMVDPRLRTLLLAEFLPAKLAALFSQKPRATCDGSPS